jgi:hypothetical protein
LDYSFDVVGNFREAIGEASDVEPVHRRHFVTWVERELVASDIPLVMSGPFRACRNSPWAFSGPALV